jgi:hypothetical protein
MADWIGVPLLGCLPVDPNLAKFCDSGCLEYYANQLFAASIKDLVARTPEARWLGQEPAPPERQEWPEGVAADRYDSSLAEQSRVRHV